MTVVHARQPSSCSASVMIQILPTGNVYAERIRLPSTTALSFAALSAASRSPQLIRLSKSA